MALEILTPFNRVKPEQVDLATKRFRKQILRPGEFDYTDDTGKQRKLKFDLSYFKQIKDAFDKQAFDSVPFQFADGKNSHDVGPERTHGVLLTVEEPTAEDGLWGQFEVSEDGAKILEINPNLGVSARIYENLRHADGRAFPAAVHQVLGTTDPVITGMKPWEAVELSRQNVTSTIDLSGQEQKPMPKTGDDTDKVVIELSVAQRDKLFTLLEDIEGAEQLEKLLQDGPDDDTEDDDGAEGDSDGTDEDSKPQVDPQTQIALSRANARIAELERRNREQEVEAGLRDYLDQGLAPAIVDLARPLLTMPVQTVIELSREGQTVKTTPREQVEELLGTVLKLSRDGLAVVGLNDELGEMLGANAETGATSALVDAWEAQFPD